MAGNPSDTKPPRAEKERKTPPVARVRSKPPKRTTKHGQLQWARSTYRTKR